MALGDEGYYAIGITAQILKVHPRPCAITSGLASCAPSARKVAKRAEAFASTQTRTSPARRKSAGSPRS